MISLQIIVFGHPSRTTAVRDSRSWKNVCVAHLTLAARACIGVNTPPRGEFVVKIFASFQAKSC